MKNNRTWLLTTLGSFLATVLGIVLTFGVSKLADIRNGRELQKQCVYNALNDISNVMNSLHTDSLYFTGWYPILPDYIERNARKEKVPTDTIAALFSNQLFQVPTIFVTRYSPVGRSIVESIPPASASDMQLHRYISLAYEAESQVLTFEDEYYKFYDRVMDINQKINCSTKNYTSEEFAEEILNDEVIQRFACHLKYVCENGIIGFYMKYLQYYRQTILQYSGITEEDYQKFREKVDQKQITQN